MLIAWIFFMRVLMGCLSGAAYFINQKFAIKAYEKAEQEKKEVGAHHFEQTLTQLIWISAGLCILVSFIFSGLMLSHLPNLAWLKLAGIITCGTLAAVLIPEFTKVFTSSSSKHVQEVVTASREGGASLNILSGITAGNFSAFWTGGLIAALMATAYSLTGGLEVIFGNHAAIFAFGLVAFGFLGMGPVTIAVDSYGPVTDNAQSIFELSQIEAQPGIKDEIKRDFGFTPDFEMGKHYLEANDGAGNTFKATAKPVLIGTAVAGATTMIFAIILMLEKMAILKGDELVNVLSLDLTQAPIILGLICGGAVIFWFSGAATQAVTTGAYEAVEFIKKNFDMNKTEADINDAKKVVEICTNYAQKGMINIFFALFFLTLAFAFINPNFFIAYLVSIAIFGLFQAIYMANAGGSWDNAKKVVEVDLKEKGTELHAASVIGDTVGDPFKDTSSVSLNPIIKFSTLFGLLAVEIAVLMKYPVSTTEAAVAKAAESGKTIVEQSSSLLPGMLVIAFLAIGLYFVWRSFYMTRIPVKK
jgi:K(+)-stimulated pyrophosphate-energized sodium pump